MEWDPMKKTNRGFKIYGEYKDSRKNKIRIQESSSAEGSYCWIFVEDSSGQDAIIHLGKPQSISPHLSKKQAKRIANALLRFADE